MQEGKSSVSSVPRNAVPPDVEAGVSRRYHLGVTRQAEVVVGAHVDHPLGRFAGGELDLDLGALRRVNEALLLEQALAAQGLELALVPLAGLAGVRHGVLLTLRS
jgi:hypothetical protein